MDLPSTKARLAVALKNPSLAKILEQHVSDLPQIQVVVADFTDPHTHQRLDILFTDSQTYTEYHHLHRWIPRSGRVIVWDQLLTKELADDPSYLQRILTKIQPNFSELFKIYSAVPEDIPPVTPSLCNGRRASPPFREDRAYTLIGGIGGLGVDLAVWMYQQGARHLVLTSRRGLKSLDPIIDALSLAKIMYLKGQDDLDLRMEACDATDVDEMHSLLRDLPAPLAGCFHMALVLADETFFRQSQRSFKSVYDSKLKVFDAFSTHVDIGGLVGLVGQSNYASACTALDGILAPYPNAFSMITPGISDAGYLDRARSKHLDRKGVYVSMSAEALWVCLEDGLRKLDDAPFNQYIPDLDWDSIDVNFTLPWSCRHLLPPMYLRQSHSKQPHDQAQILDRVLDFLEVPKGDFDVTQPLAVYGLDSISAAKLSSILRPYGSFSQMQLLGGLNWSQIETEINSASSLPADGQSATTILLDILGISPADFLADIPLSSYGLDSLGASRLATALRPFMAVTQMQLMGQTTWGELQLDHHPRRGPLPHPAAQPLVEICGGSGIPLIILPGGNGSIGLFFGLRPNFQGSVWAIQITDATPLDTFHGLVAFWKHQICAKRPHGPYRFAAYSASTLFGVALTKILEDAGEEVLGLTFIDHCPTLWLREQSEALLRTKALPELRGISDQSVLDMLRNDPAIGAEAFANYQAALRGMADAPSNALMEVGVTRAVMTIIFQFLQHFYLDDGPKSHDSFVVHYKAWISSIKARLVVIIAEHGMVNSAPGGAAPDLGTSHFGTVSRSALYRRSGPLRTLPGLAESGTDAQQLEIMDATPLRF
ncbi:KR domain-containing protein, partial [Mycena galopus ATCC 62051]